MTHRLDSARLLAVLLATAALACRPAVEEQALCGATGDLGCPTGYHCVANHCVAGEGPPTITITTPSDGANVSGRQSIHFDALSPRGLSVGSVDVLRGEDVQLTLEAVPTFATDEHLRGGFDTVLETWLLANGDYTLRAKVAPSKPPADPGTARIRIHVANSDPVIQIDSPKESALIHGQVVVTGSISSQVPLMGVMVGLVPSGGGNTVAQVSAGGPWFEGDRLGGAFEATLDVSHVAEGDWWLSVVVQNAGNAQGGVTRPVIVHNGSLVFTQAGATVVGPHRTGTITVKASERPQTTPEITAPGLRTYGESASADGLDYTWMVDLQGATSDVAAEVTATSASGTIARRSFTIPVDAVAPGAVGPVRLENRLAGTKLSFACSEPSSWTVNLHAGGSLHGTCATDRTVVAAAGATIDDRIELVDEAGNSGIAMLTEVLDEDPYVFTRIGARLPGGALTPSQVAQHLASPAVSPDLLAQPGDALGAAWTVTANEPPIGALARVGSPLRRTAVRPIPIGHSDSGALRFGLLEPAGPKARFTLYELAADGTGTPLGSANIDAAPRPAWNAAKNKLVWAENGILHYGDLFGESTTLGGSPAPAGGLGDSVICGDRFVAVVWEQGQATGASVRVRLDGMGSDNLAMGSVTGMIEDMRLACRGDTTPQLFSADPNTLHVYEASPGNAQWSERVSAGTPLPRHGFFVSEDGLLGGGSQTPAEAPGPIYSDLYRFDGASWQSLGAGPQRWGGTLVADGSGYVALGGRGPGPVRLVARSTDSYSEHPYTGLTDPPDPREIAWDFNGRKLYTLQLNSGTGELWSWAESGGWKRLWSLPQRHQATVLARTDGSVYITGGWWGVPTGYETTAYRWDGTSLQSIPAVTGTQMGATQLADGRILLAGGSLGASTAKYVTLPAGTVASGTIDTTADAMVFPTPGRDVLTWTTAGMLREDRISGTTSTPVATSHNLLGGGPVILPWANALLEWTLDTAAPTFSLLPSANGGTAPSQADGEFATLRPCHGGPPGMRRSVCFLRPDLEDPAVVELDDDPHPAMLFKPLGHGAGQVDLCARQRLGSGSASNDVIVFVYAGNTVLRPAGTDGTSCRKFSFSYPASENATIAVVGKGTPLAGTGATLELDQFVATRTNPR